MTAQTPEEVEQLLCDITDTVESWYWGTTSPYMAINQIHDLIAEVDLAYRERTRTLDNPNDEIISVEENPTQEVENTVKPYDWKPVPDVFGT